MLVSNALEGKTILITGGGTGLGKSMATYFYSLGANLVIASRKMEKVSQAAKEIDPSDTRRILALTCDVRTYQEVESVLRMGSEKFGRIDILINNAAGNFISPTERLSHKAFDTVVDIVLKGTYNCTLALGKQWIAARQKGTVLNIATTYALTGSGYVVPSSIAKAGVVNLTKSLAIEWAKYGIRMNAIAPGPFPTKGAWSRLFPQSISDKIDLMKRLPAGRVGDHQELANLAAFLISDFSSYINGEVITIDSGEVLKGAGEFNFLDEIPAETWDEVLKDVRGKKEE